MPSIREICNLVMSGAAPPSTFGARSGGISATTTDTGVGDITVNTGADTGWAAADTVLLECCRGAKAGSDLTSPGVVHTSNVAKQIQGWQEGGGGAASAAADLSSDIAVLDTQPAKCGLSIVAAGSITVAAAATAVWQSYRMAAPTYNGAGDVSLNLGADVGIDAANCVVLVTARGALAASGLVAFATAHTSDILKRVTSLQEQAAGAASILVDRSFDYVILSTTPYRRQSNIVLAGFCSVVAGVGPTFAVNSGIASAIARTGAGDYNLTLGTEGVSANACAIICTPRAVGAASSLRALSVVHTSNVVKRIYGLQEAAVGGASVAADFNFDLAIFKRAA